MTQAHSAQAEVIVPFDDLAQQDKEMLTRARDEHKWVYNPHGRKQFFVGASVLTKEGKIYGGSNCEIAALSLSMCAERTTLFTAHNEHDGDKVIGITIVTRNFDSPTTEISYPCAMCLGVIAEFALRSGVNRNFGILTANTNFDKIVRTALGHLLPYAYR